jgi:carbon-monoxide dehydrogenase small subunit
LIHNIILNVNGRKYPVAVEPDEALVDVLRFKVGLTGTKKGCGTGDCGACSVILDGRLVDSCLTLAVAVEGKEIITIEGLEKGGKLHPIQQAFLDHGAVQCGYCTPGMVLAAKVLLDANPHPAEGEIRQAISGNLCRCTGYTKIIGAVKSASEKLPGGGL